MISKAASGYLHPEFLLCEKKKNLSKPYSLKQLWLHTAVTAGMLQYFGAAQQLCIVTNVVCF